MIDLIPTALRAHAAFAPYLHSSLSLGERVGVRDAAHDPRFEAKSELQVAEAVVGWAPRAHQTLANHLVWQSRVTAGRGCPPYNVFESGISTSALPLPAEGAIPRFIPPPARALSAIDFERRVVEHNELIIRPNSLHDLLNALVWLTFPKTKRAISEAHVALGVNPDGKTRPRRRDVLTLFDESGLIILSENDTLRSMNQQHQWRELFVTHRSDFIQQTRPILFGHGAMEQIGNQLPQVHRGLTVKALWLPLPTSTTLPELDDYLAKRTVSGESLGEQERSTPMPVLGLPAWFAENELPACYDDETVFRPTRARVVNPM